MGPVTISTHRRFCIALGYRVAMDTVLSLLVVPLVALGAEGIALQIVGPLRVHL